MKRSIFKIKSTLRALPMVIGLSILLTSCGGNSSQEGDDAPLEVHFYTLAPESLSMDMVYPSTLLGKNNVNIMAQVQGYIQAIHVQEGQFVKAGQALISINSSVYNAAALSAKAAYEAATAQLELAQIELDKTTPLVKEGVYTAQELKTAQSNLKMAKARAMEAESAYKLGVINEGFTVIKATTDGYVGRINKKIGDLVGPADQSPITAVSDNKTIMAYFSISEQDYYRSFAQRFANKEEIVAQLQLPDGSLFSAKGIVKSASGAVNASTGAIELFVEFNNEAGILRSGGTAKVVIDKTLESELLIGKSMVKDIQEKFFVYRLNAKNQVEMKEVELENVSRDFYRVVKGLAQGDKIAKDRIDELFEGANVKSL